MTNKKKGFTLTEVLTATAIFFVITVAIYSGFNLSQKAYRSSEDLAELNQNGRVIIERMNREIRQAKEITGSFPELEVNATDFIKFENGHVEESYNYIHYFKDDNEIKREEVGYYFSGDPGETLVAWNAVPPFPQTLVEKDIGGGEKVIGEWVSSLKFWGSDVINIGITLQKGKKELMLETKIYGRNF